MKVIKDHVAFIGKSPAEKLYAYNVDFFEP